LSVLLVRPRDENDRHVMSAAGHRAGTIIRRTFVLLPFVSLLVHLVMLHWVYNAHLYAAYVAPVLLGIAVALGTEKLARRPELAVLRITLPILAVMLSGDAPSALVLTTFEPYGRDVTPMFLALWGAYVVYVYLYLSRFALLLLPAGAAMAGLYLFGPAPEQVASGTKRGADWGYGRLTRLLPSTTAGWGVVSVCAAFAFLAIGAMISLRKPPSDDDGHADSGPAPEAPPPIPESAAIDMSIGDMPIGDVPIGEDVAPTVA
jgi:hypothetical protein